jgi:putative transport protein
MGYDKGLAAGLMAGAITSSGTIGSASDAISKLDVAPEVKATTVSHLAVAYSVTYLFGSAGIAWFLSQVAPRILRVDLRAECARRERELSGGKGEQADGMTEGLGQFVSRAFRVRGAGANGCSVREVERCGGGYFSVERVRHGTAVLEAEPDTPVAEGDVVAVVGRREAVLGAEASIGEEVLDNDLLQFPLQTADVVVTNRRWAWRTLKEIALEHGRGIRLKRLVRLGQEMAFLADTKVQRGDTLQVLGAPRNVRRFSAEAGYAERPTPDADLTWLAAGIVLGVLVGIPALMFKGVAIGLGTSGGVLVMGLVLGYLRSGYPVFGKLPAPAGWLLETLGLNAFIAIVGLGAGLSFISGLKTFGLPLLLCGVIAVTVPHTLTLLIGKRFFPGINAGVLVGVCCGAGTHTPALLATQEAAHSKVPVLGYAVPYAIGNVLLIAWGPVLVNLIPTLPSLAK